MSDSEVRETTINWEQQLQNIIDSYEEHRGIVHGVQKDAIQNGWDARVRKKGESWKFIFEFIFGKPHSFFTMTDEGTTGLTGRVLSREELDKDLPEEERWGRFENVAFTKEPSDDFTPLGSRGRGKFVFVGASQEKTILYDTLRSDGTYRFGWRSVKKNRSPIAAYDNEEGKSKLKEMTNGLIEPLSKIGTRVIIVDPIPELVWAIQSDKFLHYIGETWWEIIKKFDAEIILRVGGEERKVTIPTEFNFVENDTNGYKVWRMVNQRVPHPSLKIRLRSLHIMSKKGETIPENLRGVSIQRGGMKICTIEPRYLPKDIADSIYGYLTLDKKAESQLRKYENPEHYGLFYRHAFPRAIKHFIEEEISRFAKEKLGYGSDIRAVKRKEQKDAERKALTAINRIAKDLGIIGFGPGVLIGGGGSSYSKEIRIVFTEPDFPRLGDRRVNYGESIKEIKVNVVNDTDKTIKVRLKLYLRYSDEKLLDLYEGDLEIQSHSNSSIIGPFDIKFTETQFPLKGKYNIVAKIVSLIDENKGFKLDIKQKVFYLEEDPPTKGLFEDCEGMEYPEKYSKLLGEVVIGKRGGYVFQYNVGHPEYKINEDDVESQAAYLFRLMAFEVCRVDLGRTEPKLFNETEIEDPDAILRRTLMWIGDFTYRYRMES